MNIKYFFYVRIFLYVFEKLLFGWKGGKFLNLIRSYNSSNGLFGKDFLQV